MKATKLTECIERFPETDIWMDSFAPEHHAYAVEQGCMGVTTSPTWVAHMVEDEWETQKGAMAKLAAENPEADERELLWRWTLQMGRERSRCMLPVWEKGDPRRGRFAIQVDVYQFRNTARMVEMALEVSRLGPNMQVKIPCTKAGIEAMEEATYQGVSVMATLCFSLAQAVAAAEAVERGLERRRKEQKSNAGINPVCAVLLGMQEEWLRAYADHCGLILPPEAFAYAGEAICKRVYEVYRKRSFAMRILVAYYRHYRHWASFMGGDLIMTIPYKWQKRFERCDVPIEENMSKPVPVSMLAQLQRLEPFCRAWEEDGLLPEEFDRFGPVVQTLQYFQKSYDRAVLKMRELLLPDPLGETL